MSSFSSLGLGSSEIRYRHPLPEEFSGNHFFSDCWSSSRVTLESLIKVLEVEEDVKL